MDQAQDPAGRQYSARRLCHGCPLYLDYQSKGALLHLQPYIDADPTVLDGIYPQTLPAYQTPSGYFGLPRDFQTIVLFYNKDMFDAAGLAYPTANWTWEDLRTTAKQLTKDINGDGKIEQYGFTFDLWDMEPGWSEALWAYGGDIISADHTKTLIGSPEARQAWQLLYDMIFVDKSVPDANTSGQYGGDLFLAGVAAMMPMGHWAVPSIRKPASSGMSFPCPPALPDTPPASTAPGLWLPRDPSTQMQPCNSSSSCSATAGQTRLAELGFACPVLKSVAESAVFLQQSYAHQPAGLPGFAGLCPHEAGLQGL